MSDVPYDLKLGSTSKAQLDEFARIQEKILLASRAIRVILCAWKEEPSEADRIKLEKTLTFERKELERALSAKEQLLAEMYPYKDD